MADDAASYGSRENLRRRGQPRGSGDTSRSTDGMYRPGQPIGFLAARGTTYEKKYLTKKLGFCCKVIAPLIVIPTLVIALVPVVWAIANHTLHVAQLHVMEANLTSITNTSFPLSLNAQVSTHFPSLPRLIPSLTHHYPLIANRSRNRASSPPRSTFAHRSMCTGTRRRQTCARCTLGP
jgi:hypothetical protein